MLPPPSPEKFLIGVRLLCCVNPNPEPAFNGRINCMERFIVTFFVFWVCVCVLVGCVCYVTDFFLCAFLFFYCAQVFFVCCCVSRQG